MEMVEVVLVLVDARAKLRVSGLTRPPLDYFHAHLAPGPYLFTPLVAIVSPGITPITSIIPNLHALHAYGGNSVKTIYYSITSQYSPPRMKQQHGLLLDHGRQSCPDDGKGITINAFQSHAIHTSLTLSHFDISTCTLCHLCSPPLSSSHFFYT